MGGLILLCGKPASGKTTLANYLAENHKVITFSADKMMLKLFGEIEDRAVFEDRLKFCKHFIYNNTEDLLKNNVSVALDFGFWTKQERDEVKRKFAMFKTIIVYLNADEETLKARVENRNKNLKDTEYFMDNVTYKFLCSMFEEPHLSENVVCYTNKEDLVNELKNRQILK